MRQNGKKASKGGAEVMEHKNSSNANAPLWNIQSETGRLNILGFWIFLGAEIVLFSTLFATYFVLHGRIAGGVLPASYLI